MSDLFLSLGQKLNRLLIDADVIPSPEPEEVPLNGDLILYAVLAERRGWMVSKYETDEELVRLAFTNYEREGETVLIEAPRPDSFIEALPERKR